MTHTAGLVALVAGAAIACATVTLAWPRALLYTTLACLPTQFLFIPVRDFFLSPADILVTGAALGFFVRLIRREPRAWESVRQHRFVLLMLVAYLVSFGVLGFFSRTIVRVFLAISVSMLTFELLVTRSHLRRASVALVIAGAMDAAYGFYFIARGTPLHEFRFSGMSGVNFSAMVIITAAGVATAIASERGRARQVVVPTALAGIGLATLSLMGLLALLAAWLGVLRHFVSRSQRHVIATLLLVFVTVPIAFPQARGCVINRVARERQWDGVPRNSLDVRWILIQTAWRGFRSSPLAGLGYSRFERYSNVDPQIAASTNGYGDPTHNSYLEVLVEGGLITFTLFALHWGWSVPAAFPAVRVAAREGDVLVASCMVGVPVVLVSAALANVLLVYSFWAPCGLALACLNLLQRERDAQQPESPQPRLSVRAER